MIDSITFKNSYVMYKNWSKGIQKLTDEQAGQLIKAICSFQDGEEVAPEDIAAAALFEIFKDKMIEDADAYAETKKNRSEAGKKGMQKRWNDNKTITNDNTVITNDNTVIKNITNITDTVTVTDTVTDKDKKKNIQKKFTPPTLEEIKAYCEERKNNVDPKAFYDYFNTGGWIDAKGQPVKNWKQKIITWEGYEKGRASPEKKNDKIHFDLERKYDFDDLELKLLQKQKERRA